MDIYKSQSSSSRAHWHFFKSHNPYSPASGLFVLLLAATLTACSGEKKLHLATEFSQPSGLRTTNCNFDPPSPEESVASYSKTYSFSSDWFTPHIPIWMSNLGHLKDKPGVQYLEIGLYEGRSAIWMLENILTHPTSRATGIDIFPNDLEARWLENLHRSGQASRVTTIKGYSQIELRNLPLDFYDIIYIDGSHKGPDVLADAILAWQHLKTGGIMIFDDYNWRRGRNEPAELRPGEAIDAFITLNRDSLEVLHRCYQLILEKRDNPCAGKEHCSPIADWTYDWNLKSLNPRKPGLKHHSLSPQEADIIEAVLRSRKFGRTELEISAELLDNPNFTGIVEAIGLKFLLPPAQELKALREKLGPKRYSQNDEETFIRDFFKDRREGFFVDVGANDYKVNSTTYFLDRHLNWSGIAVDAIDRFASDYEKYRPNTQFISAYVSDRSDLVTNFTVVKNNDRLSSAVDPEARRRPNETIKVRSVRLDDLLIQQGVDKIDFLSMDIELAELQALAGFSIEKYRPSLVCIEAHEPIRDQIEDYFAGHGYEKIELYSRLDPLNHYYRPKGK